MNAGGGYIVGILMADPPLARLPELLAPAGSMDALRAAVACGADAVYLGGKKFSARQYAGNFNDREMEEAVDFAHGRGVRIYAAVNTLLYDRELPDAARYLIFLRSIGVDAVLVQDAGLAALAREVVPGLPLHASTQMTIHNRAGLEWAARTGLKRVVLARELSLEVVEAMGKRAKELGIGLEIFVHGALCYSYSGQCLLSSAIGGRSGNRGRCAQPCRKPYSLVRGDADEYGRLRRAAPVPLGDQYLLSTKDLSLYPYLDRVVLAPVVALKIEGRMRSPEYVATVTGIYRKALDAIAAGAWAPAPADEEALALTFNRGFTGGCLCEGREGIMGRDAPDHRGILVGVVESLDQRSGSIAIRLTSSTIPEKGDGLVFRMPGRDGGDLGMVLRTTPSIDSGILWMKTELEVQPGSRVFITRRARLARGGGCPPAGTPTSPGYRIRIDLAFRIGEDGRPVLEGSVHRAGVPTMVIRREADFTIEPAREHELAGAEIEEILFRSGEAPYRIGKVSVDWPSGSYARKGDIGRMRRDLLTDVERSLILEGRPGPGEVREAGLRLERALGSKRLSDSLSRPQKTAAQSIILLTDTLDGLAEIVTEGSGYLALEPSLQEEDPGKTAESGTCGNADAVIRDAAEIARDSLWTLIWKCPRITSDSWMEAAQDILRREDMKDLPGLMVEGPGAAVAADAAFPGLPLHGGAGLNVWNARTVQVLSPAFQSLTLSPELSYEDLKDLVTRARSPGRHPLLGFPVEGNLEVMVSEDRLAGLLPRRRVRGRGRQSIGLRDGTARIFPVEADACGRTRILNSVETCLIDQLPSLGSLGIDLLVIDARGRGARYGREMASIYREGISLVESGEDGISRGLGDLREECRRRARGGITHGSFLRGLREEPAGLP
jgi:putative protease